MKTAVKLQRINKTRDEVIAVGIFEKPASLTATAHEIDELTGGMISKAVKYGDFTGKLHQTLILYPDRKIKIKRVLLVGLGKKKEFNIKKLRSSCATAACHVRDMGITELTIPLSFAEAKGISPATKAYTVTEAIILALYRFRQFKSDTEKKGLQTLTILADDPETLKECSAASKKAEVIAGAVCLARDMVSSPGNTATPSMLADISKKTARRTGMKCRIIDENKAARLGMRAFLAVGRGSSEPARFIILEHKPATKSPEHLVLVGKAITFDSGGISLKPAAKMQEMKMDMAGGAAVIATMQAIAKLKVPIRVTGIVPATENLPDGKALKPGDIIKSMGGKTIEIISTDAEGRLILADAISYARRYLKPSSIIDLATLTGACIIALGNNTTAVMGNNEKLIKKLIRSGESTGEILWQLPLWDEYREQIKSDVADIKNVGGRPAGTITAGCFLKEFAGEETPWAHLDIAGTAWSDKNSPLIPKGATGVGVRLLLDLVMNW